MPGNTANPNGRPKRGWTWADLLAEEVEKLDGDMAEIKQAIAAKLVALALGGDQKAMDSVMDRMDGKPRQSVDVVTRDPAEVVEI